jgi:O-antigen/teichoic acid export membrane protein
VSGVKELKTTGFQIVENGNSDIDYGLFKGLINAMRWFYTRVAVVLFAVLATAGTYYIHTVLKAYTGNHNEVYIAWMILVAINACSLYTCYYDALMQGKGLVKRSKQIQIAGQSIYLIVAVVMILLHFNLIAIVSAQALSIIAKRILSYRTIYTREFKRCLQAAAARGKREVMKKIFPNAVKVGLTGVGGFLVSRSAIIIGSLYLSLYIIASYGITLQIIGIISGIAGVYIATYIPKVTQYRTQSDHAGIKQIYLKGCLLLVFTFIVGGLALLFLGDWALDLIKSKTPLLSKSLIVVALIVSFLETNHARAVGILLTKNIVPFFKTSLYAGGATVILLVVFLHCTNFGVWSLILASGIVQACYSNWKWPVEVAKELKIKVSDIYTSLCSIKNITI